MLGALLLVVTASVAQAPPVSSRPVLVDDVAIDDVFMNETFVKSVDDTVAVITPPVSFLEMFVATVMPTVDGHTVVLVSPAEELLLPVGVALPEAVTIYGRLEHKRAPRPLTHDVMDSVVAALGGTVVRVQIDALVDGTFIGRVFVRTKSGVDVAVNARAADALAMALSAKAPIMVARKVIERAALTHDDLDKMPARGSPANEEVRGVGRTFDL